MYTFTIMLTQPSVRFFPLNPALYRPSSAFMQKPETGSL